MNLTNSILALAIVSSALIAGLYYAYSCSVNPGLGKLPDREYIAAMQSINQAIQNPVFFASFFGTLILLPVAAYLSYKNGASMQFYWLVAAAIIYAIGSFGVTVLGNVPLNNVLAGVQLKDTDDLLVKAARVAFEARWNNLHTIRMIASVAALVLAVVGCLHKTNIAE